MADMTDPPPLLTALEFDQLRMRLDAQDARIEELRGLLRPLHDKLQRMPGSAPGLSRLDSLLLAAPAVAVTALAVLVGVLFWQQDGRVTAASAPAALEAPRTPTAQSQPPRFALPPLRPPATHG